MHADKKTGTDTNSTNAHELGFQFVQFAEFVSRIRTTTTKVRAQFRQELGARSVPERSPSDDTGGPEPWSLWQS